MSPSTSKIFCAAILIVLFNPAPGRAGDRRWTSLGPQGGYVWALAIDPMAPQTLYAGTNGTGMFKSTDGGTLWTAINSGPNAHSLAIDPRAPQTIYAIEAGISKSVNGGGSWSSANTGLPDSVVTLAMDPMAPQTLYAGTASLGVFQSVNGGGSWSPTGLIDGHVLSLAIDPTASQVLYAGTSMGVFKSTDGGNSWTPINAGLTSVYVNVLLIDPTTPRTLYAGTSAGVFKSADGGNTWGPITAGLTSVYVNALAIDPKAPETLYVGTPGSGVFKTIDGGNSWTSKGLTSSYICTLAIDPTAPQTLFAGTSRGVSKSTDGGNSWSAVNTGLIDTTSIVAAMAIDKAAPKTLYVAADESVFKSTNGGGTWNTVNTGMPSDRIVTALAIDPVVPQTVYAGTAGAGVFKSVNGGGSWSPANTGLTAKYGIDVRALAIDPTTPQTIYAATFLSGVFKSTNGGTSWDPISTGLTANSINTLAIDPSAPQTLYAGSTGAGVFKSTNGGSNWDPAHVGLTGTSVMALAIDPTAPKTIYAATSLAGVFKSTNSGSNWYSVSTGLPNIHGLALVIDPTAPQTLYVGTFGEGVYKSTNGGNNWAAINAGLRYNEFVHAYIRTNVLVIDAQSPQNLYAGSLDNGGVWGYSMPPTTSTDIDLTAGSAAEARTAGSNEVTQAGYAKVEIKSGAAPYGTAVFSFKQNGVTVSEAGVPASPPTTLARLFIDYRSGVPAVPGRSDAGTIDVDTGIAIVNYGSAAANITYTLRDITGATISTGLGTLAAGAHFAKFIDQLKEVAPGFNLPTSFPTTTGFGSLEISSDQPLSIVALRETINQRHKALFTTTPIADLSKPPGTSPIYFPQFVDGGGYTTALVLLNTSENTETGMLQIFEDSGAPLSVSQVGGTANSSFKYWIPADGLFRFQTDGIPAAAKAGWLLLTPDAGTSAPVGAGVFSYGSGGILVSESGIPAAASTTHARVYVDLSRGHDTGLAIANPANMNASITIKAFETDGVTPIGTSQGPLQLPGNGHSAKFATEFIAGLPAGSIGVLDITSATPFAALTLRSLNNERNDFLMTTFPIANADGSGPSPVVFPQIADGGGFVTEFILLNAGGPSKTTLSFFDNEGGQLAVGK